MIKVLIADDEAATVCLLKKLIEKWGYYAVIANDGNEALEILRASDPPQIALLDWFMPGKTGIEVCSACEEENLLVYRILVTSQDRDQDLMHALDNGAHDFQSKPITPGILKSRLTVAKRAIEGIQNVVSTERLAAVGELVAGVAHHFNNLNTPILMYASSILKKDGLDPDLKMKVEKIEKAAEQAGELTEKLMAMASDNEVEKKLVNLNHLIDEILAIKSITFERDDISIEKELQTLPEVYVHESDIHNIIMNLMRNACDALVESPEKKITIKTGKKKGQIYMAISDTGCGIASDKLQSIFSIFHTGKGEFAEKGSPLSQVKGKGIGLYASKKTATKYGGDIIVESLVGKGATFTFWLPFYNGDFKHEEKPEYSPIFLESVNHAN